ncbi:Uncharacterised protein [uncultured archaeon]|nr:Uncharacterised protein [uncultured archaeon]
MFIVDLQVNFTSIRKFRCVRIKGEKHEMCEYQLDDKTVIKHHYDDGPEALAVKILQHYMEKRRDKNEGQEMGQESKG